MKIGVELNGVLRDTIGKFKQVYEKYFIDGFEFLTEKTYNIDMSGNTEVNNQIEPFEYKILS